MRKMYFAAGAFSLLISSLLFSLVSCNGGSDAVAAGSAISVRLTCSAQSVATNTDTAVSFNAETFDTDNMHDNTTNPSRITINTAGLYLVQGTVIFSSHTSSTFRECYILLNGTDAIGDCTIPSVVSQITTLNVSAIYRLEQNDYLELRVAQQSTATLNVGSSPSNFSAVRLGD